MFDISGFFTRANRDACETNIAPPRPVDYLVHKDGKPFALLNATPALAERTVTGFMLAIPDSAWSLQRV